MNKLIKHSSKNKEAIELIDYGAGNGMLGIFAKLCGIKKVFINDIDASFLLASEKLAPQLNVEIAGYIKGDINAVK